MKKIIIAGFIAVVAVSFAVYHQTREFSGAAAANLAPCAQNSDCDSGHCSNDAGAAQGICCPAGTCGWGDGSNNSRECVASDQIRENEWASLVCRNGDWKTRLNGWGCDSPGLACDQGTCQSIGGVYFQVVTDETTSGKIYNYTEAEYLVKSNKEVTTNDNRIPK